MKCREWDAELILEGEYFSRGCTGFESKAEAERWLVRAVESLNHDDGYGNYPYGLRHGEPRKVASTKVHCVWRDRHVPTYIYDY
jgi:hypothetical protein